MQPTTGRRFLYWFTGHRPLEVIGPEGEPYLERYYGCKAFGLTVYIHRFVASDPDRGLHSHPWPWAASLKLAGWYWEAVPSADPTAGHELRKPGRLHFLSGSSFHAVIMPPGVPDVWTLFIHRDKRTQWWGFLETDDPGTPGYTYTPFLYPQGAKDRGKWWLTRPLGRNHPDRVPAEGLTYTQGTTSPLEGDN